MTLNIAEVNETLREKSPFEIIKWAVGQGERPVVTTNFGPYEATLLHACSSVMSGMQVIWCDSGYNTEATYRHADAIVEQLGLNVASYIPRQTAAHRSVQMGGVPFVDDPLHGLFTEQVKLEPFRRALKEHRPDVWFTNLRKDQTAFRGTLDIVTRGDDGILKVSPFFYWSEEQLDGYLAEHGLRSEDDYYDPTKALQNRECGLHTQSLT